MNEPDLLAPVTTEDLLTTRLEFGRDYGLRLIDIDIVRLSWLGKSCKGIDKKTRAVILEILAECEAQACGPRSERAALVNWPIVVREWRRQMLERGDLDQRTIEEAAHVLVGMLRGDDVDGR